MARQTHWKSLTERFEANFERGEPAECWFWKGYVRKAPPERGGLAYPSIYGNGRHYYAHRLAYEFFVGPIPEGFQVDHLCRNTMCINPDHLEAVTPLVNTLRANTFSGVNARKTHCPQNHPLIWIEKEQRRACPVCRDAAKKRYKARKRAERLAA